MKHRFSEDISENVRCIFFDRWRFNYFQSAHLHPVLAVTLCVVYCVCSVKTTLWQQRWESDTNSQGGAQVDCWSQQLCGCERLRARPAHVSSGVPSTHTCSVCRPVAKVISTLPEC